MNLDLALNTVESSSLSLSMCIQKKPHKGAFKGSKFCLDASVFNVE